MIPNYTYVAMLIIFSQSIKFLDLFRNSIFFFLIFDFWHITDSKRFNF